LKEPHEAVHIEILIVASVDQDTAGASQGKHLGLHGGVGRWFSDARQAVGVEV
jgi:hypothetical protein